MRNLILRGRDKGAFVEEDDVDLEELGIRGSQSVLSSRSPRRRRQSSYSRSQSEVIEGWKAENFAYPSWLSIVRCRACNTDSVMGNPPHSFDYTPCRCGKSGIEWKRTQMWALEIDRCNRDEVRQLRVNQDKKKSEECQAMTMVTSTRKRQLELGLKCRKAFNGFVRPTVSAGKTLHHCGGLLFGYVGQTLKGQRLSTPPQPNSERRRFPWLKCNWTCALRTVWSHRINQLTNLASPRHFGFGVEEQRTMEGNLQKKFNPENLQEQQFEYEDNGFGFNEEVIQPCQPGQMDESLNSENEFNYPPSPWQPNFTIGSTSSLAVAMLSQASFAYFVMWFFLYCSTLDVIIPELKHLHQYTTICSLIALVIINSFRFQLCRRACKTQDVYLFTGTLTLITLVIILLVSLLTTDAYSEHRRPFNLIISSILLTLLVAEGGALLCHQRFLQPHKG